MLIALAFLLWLRGCLIFQISKFNQLIAEKTFTHTLLRCLPWKLRSIFPQNCTLQADWLSGIPSANHGGSCALAAPAVVCVCAFAVCLFTDESAEPPDPSHQRTQSSKRRHGVSVRAFTVCFPAWLLNGRLRPAAAELRFHADGRFNAAARRRWGTPGGFSG